MSILIKGMEMPEGDILCLKVYPNGEIYHKTQLQVSKWEKAEAAAVPVPTPHGPLKDVEAVFGKYVDMVFSAQTDYAEGLRDVISDIRQAPTIIEAEEGE